MAINKFSTMDGRRVAAVHFPDVDNTVRVFDEAFLSHEYYGDHAENWVVVMKDGVEVERINTRYVENIRWAKEKAS